MASLIVTKIAEQALTNGVPGFKVSKLSALTLTNGVPGIRVSKIAVQALVNVPSANPAVVQPIVFVT